MQVNDLYSHTNIYFSTPIIFSTMITVSSYIVSLLVTQNKKRKGKGVRHPGTREGKGEISQRRQLIQFPKNFIFK